MNLSDFIVKMTTVMCRKLNATPTPDAINGPYMYEGSRRYGPSTQIFETETSQNEYSRRGLMNHHVFVIGNGFLGLGLGLGLVLMFA